MRSSTDAGDRADARDVGADALALRGGVAADRGGDRAPVRGGDLGGDLDLVPVRGGDLGIVPLLLANAVAAVSQCASARARAAGDGQGYARRSSRARRSCEFLA